MQIRELTITPRPATGKEAAKRLRRAGVVPAVVYGGARPEAVTLDPKAVLRLLHGGSQLLTLKVEGQAADGPPRLAVVRELQFDPVSERLLHVDLQEVRADRAVTVRVSVRTVGEAPGVKEQGGILNMAMHEVEASCLPLQIPERIDVDVSELRIGDIVTIRDLPVAEGVRILNDPEQAVVLVSPPMAEEPVAVPEEAVAAAEPEVLSERKPKEGEAEPEADRAAKKEEKPAKK